MHYVFLVLLLLNLKSNAQVSYVNDTVFANALFDANISINTKAIQQQKQPFSLSKHLLLFYQNFISEQIQANCLYKISCSENMKQSINYYGFLRGFLMGLNQLQNCAHSVKKDYPSNYIKNDKIINYIIN